MQVADLGEAIGLLTRMPITSDGARGAKAAWAWPVVGALVGFLAAAGAGIVLLLGFSEWIASGVALAVLIILTGAMHEDGLADCADGFWGAYDPETRLNIMADSRIGTYGMIALILSLMLRWSLIDAVFTAGYLFGPLIVAAALSRVPMVVLMQWLPPARESGLSARVGRPTQDTLILSGAAALLIALLFVGFAAVPAALAAAGICWGIMWVARAKIGGQTGDVLGASQQIAEIGVLAALVILVT